MLRRLCRAALLLALAGLAPASASRAVRARFADADDRALVVQGRHVYAARCAGCHGRALQGQPLWQLDDDDRARRAPALDATGHSWQRGDAELFRIVASGAPPGGGMPGFAASLPERDVLAVIAFIKARWPVGLRAMQASLNPGASGMPPAAALSDWRFPPTCLGRGF